ncbi:MAG: elongation factor G [Azospirillaceae bacterium]|nr:elongation factor G [Azospirillaceae bacterium]
MPHARRSAPRCAALVGPYLSGKTSLLESLLSATGAITRKGTVRDGSAVGVAAPEAKARQMSVEIGLATTEYLGDRWNFLDCPGSVELSAETRNALMVVDAAVIVVEPTVDKLLPLGPLFKFLDDYSIPHIIFINKVDLIPGLKVRIRDVLAALQALSSRRLVLREVPIGDGDQISGYIDLASERAYHYQAGAPSDLVPVPDRVYDHQHEARQELLEALSDFDDALLEQLLEDIAPEKEELYRQLSKDFASDLIVPVFLGSAESDNGVRRLLKALRHETPEAPVAAERMGLPNGSAVLAQVFKTFHAMHSGKISVARIWRGTVTDGMILGGERVSGLYRMMGYEPRKLTQAEAGDIVALGRMEKIATGDIVTEQGPPGRSPIWPDTAEPVFALAIVAEQRSDEVKLTAAIQKLLEEDPALRTQQRAESSEIVLWGQGDIHLQIAIDRLRNKFSLPVKGRAPQVPYRESIRKPAAQHARFKRQSGGHGQFADIHIEIAPRPRGTGFSFIDKIVGGTVPRQFIPAVEVGVRDYLGQGPLGFPVVDIEVTLTSGQFHAVDSSEMAFKTVARMAMAEGMPKCEPVLLEPILAVTIAVPKDFTSRVQRLASSRRGQILGYDDRPGWAGWDEVKVQLPQAEIHDLIVELRSLTQGVGTFVSTFDHLAELTGRLAERVVEQRQAAITAD